MTRIRSAVVTNLLPGRRRRRRRGEAEAPLALREKRQRLLKMRHGKSGHRLSLKYSSV
jgi:hypothetical protein